MGSRHIYSNKISLDRYFIKGARSTLYKGEASCSCSLSQIFWFLCSSLSLKHIWHLQVSLLGTFVPVQWPEQPKTQVHTPTQTQSFLQVAAWTLQGPFSLMSPENMEEVIVCAYFIITHLPSVILNLGNLFLSAFEHFQTTSTNRL